MNDHRSTPIADDNITEADAILKSPQRGWRLAIAGLGHRGHFFWERWRLLNPSRVIALADDDLQPPSVERCGLPIVELPALIAHPGNITAVFVTGLLSQRGTLVRDLLSAGLSVLVEPPLAPTLIEARECLALATARGVTLRVIALRRREPDFLSAMAAIRTGRLGSPSALRWSAAEYAVWAGHAAVEYRRGETLTVAGPPLFDQLAGLTTADPRTIWGREFPKEDGFAADIDFADGRTAHIELRRTARARLQTGWMIEGTDGTYHQRRLITTTADGELVDETVPETPSVNDPLQELEAMSVLLPMSEEEQRRCLITVGLLEAVQRSIATQAPVEWDSL